MADIDNLPYPRKYRSNTMSKYIGNERNKEAAFKALRSAKRPQVILMHGDSGCGKTTFARLLAKEYSCSNRSEETGACGMCPECLAIDEYIATGSTDSLFNIQEIDITDQSGKRDLNAVLADMEIPAYGSEWKIYIFDEVHMATEGLQNRLLKIAEEPPENVLMILCTTNPERLIGTLKNRCQLQLKVSKPKVKELVGLLRFVCENEDVEYDTKGLEFLSNRSELTIRTALQNLQQVVNEQNSAKYENVIKVFEEISNIVIINLFKALKSKDVFRYVTLINEIKSKMDLETFLTELKSFVKRGIYTINGVQQDGVSDNELIVYRDLFGDLGVDKISFLLTRLLGLSHQNLELELLMLGYTGLDAPCMNSDSTNVFETPILDIDNELAKEVKMSDKVLEEKAEENFKQGVSNASKQMETVDIGFLMDMGAVLVE